MEGTQVPKSLDRTLEKGPIPGLDPHIPLNHILCERENSILF